MTGWSFKMKKAGWFSMEEIIRTEKISKQYRDVLAVDGVSLSVKKGEIYGFLGLNGAAAIGWWRYADQN
jgi:ABC-type lipopolysaccharide export system ATPase subunit